MSGADKQEPLDCDATEDTVIEIVEENGPDGTDASLQVSPLPLTRLLL